MMQFPIQNNPSKIDQGINKGFDFYTKLLQSLAMPEMMKTKQEAAKADLLKSQLNNKYYPQYTQARTDEANARAKQLSQYNPGSPSGKDLADLQNAIDTYGQNSPQADMVRRGIELRAVQDQQKASYAKALSDSIGIRYTPTTTRELAAANYGQRGVPAEKIPLLFQSLTGQSAPGQSQNTPQQNPYAGISMMGQPAPNPPVTPQEQQNPNAMSAQNIVNPTPQEQPDIVDSLLSTVSPSDKKRAAQEADLTKSEIVKKGITAQQANQRLYADAFSSLEKMIDPDMKSITKFSGLWGKPQAVVDRALSAMGSSASDPDYQKYKVFMGVELPAAANEFRRQMGSQATDYETKLLHDVLNPNAWDRDPQLAMKMWEANKQISGRIRKNAYRSQSQMVDDFNKEVYGENNEKSNRPSQLPLSNDQQDKLKNSNSEVLNKIGIKSQPQKFQTRTENGKVMVQGPNGKWYSADEL